MSNNNSLNVNLSKKQIDLLKDRATHNETLERIMNEVKSFHKDRQNPPADSDQEHRQSKLRSDSLCLYRNKLKLYQSKENSNDQEKTRKSFDKKIEEIDRARPCGCLKTSEKLKEIMKRFPAPPPPPSPVPEIVFFQKNTVADIPAFGPDIPMPTIPYYVPKPTSIQESEQIEDSDNLTLKKVLSKRLWRLSSDILQIIQISLTTTAIGLYYILYFYMQIVYYTLISAMFFHNADGPMKITIGVVTVTSVIVGFNLILRMEKFVGITINE